MASLKLVVSTPSFLQPTATATFPEHPRSSTSSLLVHRLAFQPHRLYQQANYDSASSSSSVVFASNRVEPVTSRRSFGSNFTSGSGNDNSVLSDSENDLDLDSDDDDDDDEDGDDGRPFVGSARFQPSLENKDEQLVQQNDPAAVEQLTGALSRYLWSQKKRPLGGNPEKELSFQERRELANSVSADDPMLLATLDSLKGKLAPSDLGTILLRFGNEKRLDKLSLVFDWMKVNKKLRPQNVVVFITMMGKAGFQWKALRAYKGITDLRIKRDTLVRNALIKVLVQGGNIDKAFKFFNECKADGFNPDSYTYNTLISGCAKQKDGYFRAKGLLAEMFLRGMKPDTFSYTSLLHVCANGGLEEEAKALFEEMKTNNIVPTIYHYSALMNVFAEKGKWEDAEKVYNQIKDLGLPMNQVVLNSLMKAYANAAKLEKARDLFNNMEIFGFPPGEITYSLILDMYCKNGEVEEAESLFEEMKQKGVPQGSYAFSSLISTYGKLGRVDRVEALEKLLESEQRDSNLYNTLLKCYCEFGMRDAVMRILKNMDTLSVTQDRATFNILLNYFSKEGLFELALHTLADLKLKNLRPNLNSYAPLIEGLAGSGKVDEALGLYKEMKETNIGTSPKLVSCVVKCLCKEKRGDEAFNYFCQLMEMEDMFLAPSCIEDMLIQAGSQIELLRKVFKKVSIATIDMNKVDLVAVFSAYHAKEYGAAITELFEYLAKSDGYGKEGLNNLIGSLQEAGQEHLSRRLLNLFQEVHLKSP